MDITLAQHPDIFGAGEITALTRHVWPENEYCACGRQVRDCPVWSEIFARWTESNAAADVMRYHCLQRRFESLLGMVLIRLGLGDRFGLAEYLKLTESLLRTIALVCGNRQVVDSSKLPGRAHALSRLPGIDLAIIHLVRDGRAVAWSMAQPYDLDVKAGFQKVLAPKPVTRTALRWTLVNLMTEFTCRHLSRGHYVRIAYEDFAKSPEQTLAQVGEALGVDLSTAARALAQNEPIFPTHQVAGSRVRMKREMVLAPDRSWQTHMPVGRQVRVRRVCGFLLRRYGYI